MDIQGRLHYYQVMCLLGTVVVCGCGQTVALRFGTAQVGRVSVVDDGREAILVEGGLHLRIVAGEVTIWPGDVSPVPPGRLVLLVTNKGNLPIDIEPHSIKMPVVFSDDVLEENRLVALFDKPGAQTSTGLAKMRLLPGDSIQVGFDPLRVSPSLLAVTYFVAGNRVAALLDLRMRGRV